VTVLRVTGTTDLDEIAAVVAAVTVRSGGDVVPSSYERWRHGRLAALRASRSIGNINPNPPRE
jgi:hypothetical protein